MSNDEGRGKSEEGAESRWDFRLSHASEISETDGYGLFFSMTAVMSTSKANAMIVAESHILPFFPILI